MKYFLPILVSGLCVIFCACKENMLRGEGAKGSITPSVSSFSGLDVSMSAKVVVNVQEGAQPAVRVSGFENVLKYVRADVSGNVLHIHFDNTGFRSFQYDDMTIEVTMPAINSLSLSGAPDAEIHGNVTGRALNISVSGSSSVDIDNLNTDNFSMDISGSGALNIKGGHVKSASYQVSGSGDVSAFPLQSDRTEASISGSGSGKVTALQSLSANISGSGSISYKGHPSVSQHVSGTGSIMDAN